jgi:hypothetical protein
MKPGSPDFKSNLLHIWPLWLLLWRLKFDILISRLLGLIIILLNLSVFSDNKKPIILCMERNIFLDDVKALKEHSSKYKFVLFNRYLNGSLIRAFWPEELKEQSIFYAKKKKFEGFFKRISKICYNTMIFLESFTGANIDFILTGNINYYQDYPWLLAIHEKNGKFVALNKESMVYLSDRNVVVDRIDKYKFKYEGDAVLFYNNSGMKRYIQKGSVTENQSYVSGCPRVDRLVNIAKQKKKTKNFVLFALFSPFVKSIIPELYDEILEVIYQDKILRDNTIIKCKYAFQADEIKEKYIGLNAVSDSLENYIKNYPAIFLGYSSIACYDALIAGTPVVIPWWDKAAELGEEALLGEHTSEFHLLANSKESLGEILNNYVNRANKIENDSNLLLIDNPSFKKLMEDEYSCIDGKNCERFFEIIDQLNK